MGEDAADQDCPTLVSFLIVELAAAVAKLADGRRRESAVGAAGIVEAPLARSRIVEAQGRNSIWPEGPSASSSTRLAFPFQTFRTWETPSQCFHVVELARGFASRSTWTFQLPSSKSKSCAPSCRGGGAGCCARAAGINREPTQRKRSILGNARRCFWFIIPGLLFHGCGGRWLRARMHFPVIWLPDGNRHHNREPCCPARVDYGLPVDGGRECHRRQVEPDLPLLARFRDAAVQSPAAADAGYFAQGVDGDAAEPGRGRADHAHGICRGAVTGGVQHFRAWAEPAAADRSGAGLGAWAYSVADGSAGAGLNRGMRAG